MTPSLLGADLTAKHCSSHSSPLVCPTPCHKQTQLKTCLRDKPKHSCQLICPVPSAGDAAKSPWMQEEQNRPTGVSNTWEQLAQLTPYSTPASPGGSATSSKPLCDESPKERARGAINSPLQGCAHPPTHTPLCCIARHHPGYTGRFAGRQPLLCI